MPIYEYYCEVCKSNFELIQKISDKPAKKCIKCNYNINLKKVRVIFKTEDNNELGNLIKDARKRVENGNLFVEP